MDERAGALKEIDEIIGSFIGAVSRLDDSARRTIADIADVLIDAFEQGKRVYVCGNGGSAADAQHIAGELVGRFRRDSRRPLPCMALTTDTSIITAVGNDFGFEKVFSRQVEAMGDEDEVLWVLSTSGKSPDIIEAVKTARERGMKIIAMTGGSGGDLPALADTCFIVSGKDSYLIQQVHQLAYHIICELVDRHFAGKD